MDRPASGQVSIDASRGRARCERCGCVRESADLADLLSFSQTHHACPGPARPPLLEREGAHRG